MSDSDSEEDCCIIRPTLIKQLKSIPEQYPDDGQILKELIQNAEDAGASEVTFVYDHHSHGTKKLYHRSLAIHQGPGLLAYNNASFTEKDWIGIRSLYESIKEKDPLKVGRFGLGFKSVFHLTDLPSILSGQKLLILDPHENIPNNKGQQTSGKMWNLKKDKASLTADEDQFTPYLDLFGCNWRSLQKGDFEGTLFRFPLRRQQSKISQTVYNDGRMKKLFDSFEADAHVVLLFLKTVQKIVVSERNKSDATPQIKFVVQTSETCREAVRKEKADFLKKISEKQPNHLASNYQISIEILQNGRVKDTHRYLVRECYASGQVSTTFFKLRQELETSYIPMVGVAMQLTDDEAENRSENPEGQTFCVLPLPREQRSSSGLPVHINGYFSVDQNRRHLKWKTTGQHDDTDKDVSWNNCLMTEVLPLCYVDLIKTAIELQRKHRHRVSIDDIYAAVPNLSLVDEKWQSFVHEMFHLLLQEQWLFTPASGGNWVSPKASILDATDEYASVVREVLLATGQNVVTPPAHISTAVRDLTVKLTPKLIRTVLQENSGSYTDLDSERKMALLAAILQDLTRQGAELLGIRLIPLANGTFAKFRNPGSSPVYIPSTDQQKVLRELRSQLLDIKIAPDLLTRLKTVAEFGKTCLKEVTSTDMPGLVETVLPQEWQGKTKISYQDRQGPSAQWFEQLWKYLTRFHEKSLVAFEGLMIMPLTSSLPMEVITLDRKTSVILAHSDGAKLGTKLHKFLTGLGVFILDRMPEFVSLHPKVLGVYIKAPTTEHVLGAILSASVLLGLGKVDSLLASDCSMADELVTLVNRGLETEGYRPSSSEIEFLKQLPLFPTTKSTAASPEYASADEVSGSTADRRLVLNIPCRLLFAQNEKILQVSRFLGIELLHGSLLLRKYIIPCIEKQEIPPEEIRKLMVSVSECLPSIAREDGAMYRDFSRVAFVETESAKLMKPCELFDPNSSLCQKLFSSMQDMFPCGVYVEQDMLAMLTKMGLKKEEHLQSRDIEQVVLSLKSAPLEMQRAISTSILQVLNSKPDVFCRDRSLVKVLQSHPWVPVSRDRIDQYPQRLKWMGSTSIGKPSDVVALKSARILGSVKAVVSEVAPGLEEVFSWRKPPSPHLVVEHLKNVVASYHLDEKAAYLRMILKIYRYFEGCDQGHLQEALKDFPNWLWVGDQFALAEHVVLQKSFMNLHPFVHSLPEELHFLKPMLSGLRVRTNVDMSMLVNVLHRIKHVKEEDNSLEMSENNLQMVVAILNHIRKNLTHMDESLKARLLVPVDCDRGQIFDLQLVGDCSYCDKEWMRKGFNIRHVDAESEQLKLIHRDIPPDTARDLGVTPLIKRVLHSDQLQITAFGQSESLANRIKHLLQDYPDGLAVFKEMVQNADDAGATEVKFLYDERANDNARTSLLDPNMKGCQGAALWIYNDAVFNKEDFNNIVSLGNSSKEKAPDKVGKFGLGFNVVYNLTDVPSFVTGESVVMFDPQMSHLSEVIEDKSNPGIKLNIKRNRLLFKSCSDQFLPFQDIYGCDLSEESDQYQGTLFRLPLRTAGQASTSKLSNNHYNRTEMIHLLQMLEENAHRLLLFTQNVTNVTLDYLPKNREADQPIPIFTAQKNVVNMVKELSSSKGDVIMSQGISGMLSFVAANAEALDDQSRLTALIRTTKKELPGSKKLYTKEECSSKRLSKPEHFFWIISTVIWKQPRLTTGNPDFQIGGIAMQVQKEENVGSPETATEHSRAGSSFLWSPLPVYCDLPVHVNGNFALHSSRRAFPQGTGDDKYLDKIEWNKSLMQNVLSEAYLYALEDSVKVLQGDARVEFHKLWPSLRMFREKDHLDVSPLLDAFFSRLWVRPGFPLLCDNTGLVTMEKAVFIDEQLVADSKIKQAVLETMAQLRPSFRSVVLPTLTFEQLQKSDQANVAKEKWYDFHRYFREIVFPNFKSIAADKRENLVGLWFALKQRCVYNLKMDTLDCVGILSSLKGAYKETPLKPPFKRLACSVLECLAFAMQKDKIVVEDLEQTVFLLNVKHVLKPLQSLYYTNDSGREKDSIVCSDVPLSTVRALGVKSWRDFLYDNKSKGIGLPFGQCEDLPNAIKRVLETYPRDHEILKELIQNADDAKATKIHFILDQQHHPSESVFADTWKPLQGPALCVYSDSSFTKGDLEGIQAFGIGAKRHDPSKTDQYGIGFNSVYHITDVPSVMTSGPGVSKTLCVFDPQCKFVPGATPEKPGRQFDDLESLKDEFSDVFKCYLEEDFIVENATMMRFPLRDKLMANTSLISKCPSPDIEELFSLLKGEANETLLFLNHLKEIEMSIVTKTGQITSLSSVYKVKAELCPQKGRCKKGTARKAEALFKHFRENDWSMESIPLSTSLKRLEIVDNEFCKETWLVAESLGYESDVSIPESVREMIQNGEFTLLPKGGVAAPIASTADRHQFKGRVFCVLPMPLETKLPVHVNGRFALGHENRRHLWTYNDKEGYKREWNDFLCENVISVAYVKLLLALKDEVTRENVYRGTLESQLRNYQSYFPVFTDDGKNWQGLIRACYKGIGSEKVPLLPVIVTRPAASKGQDTTKSVCNQMTVKWRTLQTEGKLKVFFPDKATQNIGKEWMGTWFRNREIEEKQILHQLLVRCHFALLDVPEEITRQFEQSGVPITRISPREVLSGFPSRPLCNTWTLPDKIEKTPIQTEEALVVLLKYCATDDNFVAALEHMPFLLTADDQLHKFDPESPACYTRFQSIFLPSDHTFIKPIVFVILQKYTPCKVMRPFTIADLPRALGSILPSAFFDTFEIRLEESNKWKNWFKSFWGFIGEQLKDLTKKSANHFPLRREALQRLKCIEDWCLIPTKARQATILVPIIRSSVVLAQSFDENKSVFRILHRSGVHVLNTVYEPDYRDGGHKTLQTLVTTTKDARTCLHILHSALQKNSVTLNEDDAEKLIKFFCDNLEMLRNNELSASELKDLQIHKSSMGVLSELTGYKVYRLAEDIPAAGLQVSQEKTGVLLLRCSDTLQPLYEFLGVHNIDRVYFYCVFFLQQFELQEEIDRQKHIWYLYNFTRQGTDESRRLLKKLKEISFITAADGSLQRANYFYDQHNPVFAAFMPELAPPKSRRPFSSISWHEFLSEVGLVKELSPDVFLDCARQVASQMPCDQTLTRSKVLINFLFDMKRNAQQQTTRFFSDQDLYRVSEVAFVEPVLVSAKLANMCQPVMAMPDYIQLSGAVPSGYEKLVWTQVPLLPTWADPEFAPLNPKARDELSKVLGILEKPPLSLVLDHMCTLAEHLVFTETICEQSRLSLHIFKTIYRYLQEQDSQETPIMKETKCILVESGTTLVAPKQIVRNLPEEIVPFLYQIPDEMMTFQDLFLRLGGTERANVNQYAMVLEKLHMETNKRAAVMDPKTRTTVMDPNQTKCAFLAVKGLFETLDNSDSIEGFLYLPSTDGTMCRSTELVYNDVPSFFSRINQLDGEQLVNLVDCGVVSSQVVGAVEKLPKQHRPRFVSREIEEVLDSSCQILENSEVANWVNKRVNSEVFRRAVKQLLMHEDCLHNRRPDDRELQESVDRLEMVKVHAVDRLQTNLKDRKSGRVIADSSADKVCHVEKKRSGISISGMFISKNARR